MRLSWSLDGAAQGTLCACGRDASCLGDVPLEDTSELAGCYVTLGNFDGVHRGHVALLQELVEWARGDALTPNPRPERPAVAITFNRHPRQVLGDGRPQTLIPLDHRLELMERAGIDHAVVIDFTREFSQLTAEQFASRFLRETLRASGIILGWNSFFGHNRRGNLAFLQEHGGAYGLEVRGQDPLLVDHAPISSSRIRHAVQAGDLASARTLLGRAVTVTGEVVHGDQRGRTIGFPTANLRLQQDILPPTGVYLSSVHLGAGAPAGEAAPLLPSLTNIGVRPTFDGGDPEPRVETWIRGHGADPFAGDLYGQRMTVQLHELLRPEERFAGVDDLKRAIEADRAELERRLEAGWAPTA